MRHPILIKNLILHVLLAPFYWYAWHEIAQIPADKLDTLVLFVGLIVIAPISSNFIYSYSDVNTREALKLGHLTTFFSTLVIGMLFVALDILLLRMLGNILVFRIAILTFWIAVVSFDFADYELTQNGLKGIKKRLKSSAK